MRRGSARSSKDSRSSTKKRAPRGLAAAGDSPEESAWGGFCRLFARSAARRVCAAASKGRKCQNACGGRVAGMTAAGRSAFCARFSLSSLAGFESALKGASSARKKRKSIRPEFAREAGDGFMQNDSIGIFHTLVFPFNQKVQIQHARRQSPEKVASGSCCSS